jgi:hypothetical protein
VVKGGGEGRDSVRVTTHGPCQCAATPVKHIRELPRKEGYSPLQPHPVPAEGGVEASRSERHVRRSGRRGLAHLCGEASVMRMTECGSSTLPARGRMGRDGGNVTTSGRELVAMARRPCVSTPRLQKRKLECGVGAHTQASPTFSAVPSH